MINHNLSPVSVDINTPSLNAFNDLLNITLKSFLDQSSQNGDDVKSILFQFYTLKKKMTLKKKKFNFKRLIWFKTYLI
jgi:hypothetical protein